MAFILSHFWPGATEEQYRAEIAAVHPADGSLPKGQIYHAAGAADGGILIVAVWDCKESSDLFISEVLKPNVLKPGGFSGDPIEKTAESFNVQTQ